MRYLSFLALPVVIFAGVLLVSFTATAHAAGALHASDGSLWDLFQPVYTAFAGGQYWYAGSMATALGCALAKRWGGDSWPWVHTDWGGALLALVGATAGSIAAALGGTGTMSWSIASTALTIGVGAAGGYTVVKHLLITPVVTPLVAKLPPWAQKIARVFTWMFDGAPTSASTPAAPSVTITPSAPPPASPPPDHN